MTQHHRYDDDEVRLDLGEGPSSPTLQASIRVRPITIRFTEPGVRDLKLHLRSITSLRSTSPPAPTSTTKEEGKKGLIFDYDAEQHDSSSPAVSAPTPPKDDTNGGRHLAHDVIDALSADGLMGDESSRSTFRQLALDADGQKAGGVDESDEDSEGEQEGGEGTDDGQGTEDRDTVEKRDMSVRELVDWLSAQAEEATIDANSGDIDGRQPRGKGKNREPIWFSDTVRLTIRTAPTVYIQCSVGEPTTQPSSSTPLDHPSTDLIDASPDPFSTSADLRNRGFNRLLDAGLTHDEISTIRTQFRTSHPLSTTYDLIQAHEHAQHLLEMEESWMDTFSSSPSNPSPGSSFDEPPTTSGAYLTVMQGLMVGFFLPPLIPLFWFRDKPHPSSLPSGATVGEGEEEDEEEEWENERLVMTRESVLGSTMQISILFGVVANVIMGIFRFIW
ncbi:uncharacterized protein SPSC_01382 [Sporisorium scitamineum]|uniref:DSC E3 ubiquitin ligase complex subunit 3 C-terminal domain-containing protein n=1 Tax=Sporisorium scitamineum TaxID=49012 RepID=A0A127Z9V9_9BASI|nr:uncharacterized protein SPSC_01382 [Sporisorium scitamineum]